MNWKKIVTLFAMSPIMLLAQTSVTELENQTDSQSKLYEKMEVTGSYIKRVDMEGAQAVQTLDRDYLDKTGYNSVGDVMRDLTASSFGGAREDSGSSVADTATVSLRGLGADRTLVLLNGRRMAKDGIGAATDLNLIPMSAVERIDVLKNGGSATYGSDAVGGVVNIILKKNYVGAEINLRQEMTELKGGNRQTISGVFGSAGRKGQIVTSFQYRNNEKIFDRDREFTKEGSSINSPVPSIYANGGFNTLSGCKNVDSEMGACRYNYASESTGLPKIEQINALTSAQYNLNSLTEIHVQASGARKETLWNYAPGVVALSNFAAPKDITLSDGTVITAGTIMPYVGWRSEALGNRDTKVLTTSYAVNAGVKRYIGESWEADLTVGTERIKRREDSLNGYSYREPLVELINNGTCDIFTPGADLTACSAPGVKATPFQITKSRLDTVELKTTGEAFDLPAGPLGVAIGSQVSYETYNVEADEASVNGEVVGGGAQSPGSGTRHVTAVFGELAIPITEKIETQLSGRYDKYSDFGDTFNPQVNVRYKPISSVLLRGSAGTGFKAPNMQDLYASKSEGYPTFIDQYGCAQGVAGACKPSQWLTSSSGNKGLKEETSKSWNVGAVIEPNKTFSISADYYSINLSNTVGTDLQAITQAELKGIDVSQYGIEVERDSTGRLIRMNAPTLNLAETQVNGIDLNIRYAPKFGSFGDLIISNNTSYLTKYEETKFPGLSPVSVLSADSGAPKWRNNLDFDYGFNDYIRFGTTFRTIGSNNKTDPKAGKIKSFTQIDLRFSYMISSWNTKATAGVVNLFNKFPEMDKSSSSSQLNSSLYDPIGRRVFAGLTSTF